MKNNITYILVTFFLFVCNTIKAQDLRVIDNKGTRKSINKVTQGVSLPANPVKGDINFDNFNNTNKIEIFDGVTWRNLNVYLKPYSGYFIISYSDNGTQKKIKNLPFKPSKVTFVAHANIGLTDVNADNDYTGFGSNDNVTSVENSFGSMNGYATLNTSGGITQQVIYLGGHGNSINDISRYASSENCIGLRFSEQNGGNLGVISAKLSSFDEVTISGITNYGFSLNVSYTDGEVTFGFSQKNRIRPKDIRDRKILVLYTAYR